HSAGMPMRFWPATLTALSRAMYVVIGVKLRDMKSRLSILATLFLFAIPLHAADEVKRLHALFDKNWEMRLKENPMFATSVGRHEYDDRLSSVTPADLARRQVQRKTARVELLSIDRSKLPAAERVNYDM